MAKRRKKIDYSKFALAKAVPTRSPKHLAYVRTFPCCACCETEDNYVVPLCAICHHYLHWLGERSFWTERKLEPTIYAALLWDSFQKTQGKRV